LKDPAAFSTGTSVGPGDLPAVFGRYRIERRLARGGMGTVYLAHDTLLVRDVALKVPLIEASDHGEWLARFYREARAAAALRHPNLCPVFDVGEIDGTPYLTMAYIEGHSLAHLCGRAHSAWHCAIIVRKIALAMAEAHRHGVLHRDLKPANIMIDRRSEPIVMDFGLARRNDADDARLTHSGAMLGTPAYMPPEQVVGDVNALGPTCDVYSLGVILYELLCGRPPFEGPTAVVLGQILGSEPIPPSRRHAGVDPALEAVCLKAMAKQPQRRYASMDEFAAALTDYLRTAPQSPAPTPLPAAPPSVAPGPGAPTILPQFTGGPQLAAGLSAGATVAGYGRATSASVSGSSWLLAWWLPVTVLAFASAVLLAGLLVASVRRDHRHASNQTAAAPAAKEVAKPSPAQKKPPQSGAPPAAPKSDGALAVSARQAVKLRPGEHVTLEVHVERQGCQGAVEILWSHLPRSVAGNGAVIPSAESAAQLELIAADDAEPTSTSAVMSASLGALQATTDVQVVIEPKAAGEQPAEVQPGEKGPGEPPLKKNGQAPKAAGDQKAAAPAASEPHGASPPAEAKEFTNSINMKLVLVPSGEFLMGSGESTMDLKRTFGALPAKFEFDNANEHPVHSVKITRAFYMGMYEVTKSQFAAFVEAQHFVTDAEKQRGGLGWDERVREFVQLPKFSWRNTGFEQTGDHPVVNVSWGDAEAFCAWLSLQEGKPYRLPSEAEWEYACRAGTTTRFYGGDDVESLVEVANVADATAHEALGTLFFVPAADGFAFTAPAGRFRPNAFGLYDMTGNVWEWCSDWYDPGYYASSAADDPTGPVSGLVRVARGGSFNDPPVYERSARRACLGPLACYCGHGFRVVCEAGTQEGVRRGAR
jgi:formylglycine-generating enzyme required for sulfatase activity